MKRISIYLAILSIGLALLACRPVIAIGWEELLTIILIIAFLLGPTLYRIYRVLDKIRKAGELDNQKKKKK